MTLVGDAIHSMPPVGGLGGNAALRDANLLYRTLTAVDHGKSPLIPALHRYGTKLRASGYAAVRAALHTQRQGLGSNHATVAVARAWSWVCRAVPRLRQLNLAHREQARPRPWER